MQTLAITWFGHSTFLLRTPVAAGRIRDEIRLTERRRLSHPWWNLQAIRRDRTSKTASEAREGWRDC